MLHQPGDRIGGWLQLEHLLGRGGVGSVWCARDVFSDRLVAVKLLDSRFVEIPEVRLRFEREAAAAASLDSPHVVKVLGHGVDDETPFIVMELLEGEDLARRLKRRKRLSLDEVAALVRQIGHALDVAHAAGIVHRDLKPANVFLARTPHGEVVKVLDFGLAKLTHGRGVALTATGDLLGTVDTMSPEQIIDPRGVDERSDLWSLAVVALIASTGSKPFSARSLADAIMKIARGPTPRASDLSPDMSPALVAFFDSALQRDRSLRFQSARELVAAFDDAVSGSCPSFGSTPMPSVRREKPSLDRDDDDDAKTTQLAAVPWRDSSPPVTLGVASVPPPPCDSLPLVEVADPRPPRDGGHGWTRAVVAFAATFMLVVGAAPRTISRGIALRAPAGISAVARRAASSCAWQAARAPSSDAVPPAAGAQPPR